MSYCVQKTFSNERRTKTYQASDRYASRLENATRETDRSGCHASMSFICRRLQERGLVSLNDFSECERAWLTGAFAKVCCRVDSEEELMAIHEKAVEAGLEVHLITDSGKTEFHGVPTRTCLAIGPDDAEKIDAITGQLQLL